MALIVRLVAFFLTALTLAACGVDELRPVAPDTTVPGTELPGDETLLVVGDWGSGTDSQEDVSAEMAVYAERHQVAAILTTGDNFYSDDPVELMKPFDWVTERGIPILISWGNHDVDTPRRVEVVDETFDDPPRWWRHEWGPIDVVILDSTQVESPQQRRFIMDEMETRQRPTIVVFHHPPLSCGSHGDSDEVRDGWVPQFDNDVFLVLNGHEHNYQRFEADDVTYVVTGGGGQSITELRNCPDGHPPRIAGQAAHHFVAMALDDSITATAIDSDGNVIDEFTLPWGQ